MAVYRPSYPVTVKDPETGKFVSVKDPKTGKVKVKRSKVWWYHFNFAGRHIQESSKSTRKTLAIIAEKNRRLELEKGFNNVEDNRKDRIRTIGEIAAAYLEDYKLRSPRSATFAEYAIGHITRLVGQFMTVDFSSKTVTEYQTARLKESAASKSINDEVGFLLRILGEQGDFIRAKLRRERTLKLKAGRQVSKAYTPEEKAAMLAGAKSLRSPAMFPALTLALNCGLRDAELRGLQWDRLDLAKAVLTVGDSKSEAGEGRTIPLNAEALRAMVDHAKWYLKKFGETRPEYFVFPFGKPQPTDPTRPMVTLKTAWVKVRTAAGVSGRWHDNRHTFITDLAESGEAGDETIRDLAGHVSKQMLKHYSHIRMEAKRRAVDSIGKGERAKKAAEDEAPPNEAAKGQTMVENDAFPNGAAKESAKVAAVN